MRKSSEWILAVVLAAALVTALYQLVLQRAAPELLETRKRLHHAQEDASSLAQRLERTEQALTIARNEADISRQASRLLRDEENQRQQELNSLRAEVEFYRRLSGAGGGQSGLDVFQAELETTASERVFRYVITLVHTIRRARPVSGRVRLTVSGVQDDQPRTLRWNELRPAGEGQPAFSFKYFQQVDGMISLPPGFRALSLHVLLEQDGQRGSTEREFDWEDALIGPAPDEGSD